MNNILRMGVSLALAGFLSACGGGDSKDDGGSNPPPTSNTSSISVSPTSVAAEAIPGSFGPIRTVFVTAANIPEDGLFVRIDYTSSGIEAATFTQVADTQANVDIQFRDPVLLEVGTYEDDVTINVCYDDACTRHVAGSPSRVTASLAIIEPSTVSLDIPDIDTVGKTTDNTGPSFLGHIAVDPLLENGPYVEVTSGSNGVERVSAYDRSFPGIAVAVDLKTGSTLSPGTYQDDITFKVCYDVSCIREIAGSPLTMHSKYTIDHDARPESGIDPLEVASRTAISHDVVDAEYSSTLDALVMVASLPQSALYVYDMTTGTETQVLLSRAPTAVSISPDGMSAAVGHDALITYVANLTQVGQPGAPAPTVLHLSAGAFDLVLDGHGFVHVFPEADQWVNVHSVEIATDTETLGTGFGIYARTHARLHPSGDYLYDANTGISPSDISKHDITTGLAQQLYDSPYHGDYEMCGNLWFDETGAKIYTRCGNIFRSSTTQAQDMLYDGALELSHESPRRYMAASLSQSAETHEVALIEEEVYDCGPGSTLYYCYTHLNLYDSDSLSLLSTQGFPPVDVGGDQVYSQRGLFVFHNADGTRRYLISRLIGVVDPQQGYYVSVVE